MSIEPLASPLWNAMGAASMVGLGLALAQPFRPVLVIAGDGELLIQLGCLATIAAKKPLNHAIVVLEEEVYQEPAGSRRTRLLAPVCPTQQSLRLSLRFPSKNGGRGTRPERDVSIPSPGRCLRR